MFKNLLRELESLGRELTVKVPVVVDELGYVDRECPAVTCVVGFKVLQRDWADKFRSEAVFCPRCGHEAPSNEWFTMDQHEHAKAIALQTASSLFHETLRKEARAFNAAQPRNSLVRITMNVSGVRSMPVLVPPAAAAVLEQALECPSCGAGYAVLGPAFFCPCCGRNGVEDMFGGTIAKVRLKVPHVSKTGETRSSGIE